MNSRLRYSEDLKLNILYKPSGTLVVDLLVVGGRVVGGKVIGI